MPRSAKTDHRVESVLNALAVLEEFRGAESDLGVTELSHRLKIHKNSVFRLLATLESRGYIVQAGSFGDYEPGAKVIELGLAYRRASVLLNEARPVLEDVSRRCNETVYLGVLRGVAAMYVDVVETTLPVRVSSRIGDWIPAHCTAMGKTQLAHEPPDVVEEALGRAPLKRYTARTITDPAALADHLAEVRRRGYALDEEEYEVGVRCVAVPVREDTGRVIAGFSISGPAYRLTEPRIERDLIRLAQEAGAAISSRLGWPGRAATL